MTTTFEQLDEAAESFCRYACLRGGAPPAATEYIVARFRENLPEFMRRVDAMVVAGTDIDAAVMEQLKLSVRAYAIDWAATMPSTMLQ